MQIKAFKLLKLAIALNVVTVLGAGGYYNFFSSRLYANNKTFVLLIAISLLVYLFTHLSENKNNRFSTFYFPLLFITILMIYLQRTTILIFISYRKGVVSIEEFNKGLLLLLIFLGAYFAGSLLAGRLNLKKISIVNALTRFRLSSSIFYNSLLAVGIFSVIVSISFSLIFSWKMGLSWRYGWVSKLLPLSLLATTIFLLFIVYGKYKSRWHIAWICIYCGLYLFYTFIIGSRGGLFAIFWIIIPVIFLKYGNFRIKIKYIFFGFIMLFIFGAISWSGGSYLRRPENYNIGKNIKIIPLELSRRLGAAVESYFVVVNKKGNQEIAEKYFKTEYVIKSIINGLLPGDVFSEPISNLGHLWLSIYKNKPLEKNRNHGHVWSGFGLFFFIFGLWAIPVVFFYSVITTIGLKILVEASSDLSKLIAVLFFHTFVFIFFISGNIDEIIDAFARNCLFVAGVLILAGIVNYPVSTLTFFRKK